MRRSWQSSPWYLIAAAAAKLLQSCPTLCHPIDGSPPGSSVHGILQSRILDWVAISFSRGTSQPRDWTLVSCLTGRFFTIWATGKCNFCQVRVLSFYVGKTVTFSLALALCVCVCVCGLVSKSFLILLWPRGLQPARLLCPWNFLGKNTGVGCHFLLH